MDERVRRVRAIQERIEALLEDEKRRIYEEIRAYPTPIARCDQQFNQLIDRRELIFRQSARLAAAVQSGEADSIEWLHAFIDSSECLEAGAKLLLKAALSEGTDAPEGSLRGQADARLRQDATGGKPWQP